MQLRKPKPAPQYVVHPGFEYRPPILIEDGTVVQVTECEAGHIAIERRDLMTGTLLEIRRECMAFPAAGGVTIVYSMPGSIRIAKRSWRLRFLKWLASGGAKFPKEAK